MSLTGRLEDVSLVDVLQFIHYGRRTGTLSVQRGEEEARIGFHQGAIVSASSSVSQRLGDLLIEEGVISQSQLQAALEKQAEEPRQVIGQILLKSGAINLDQIRSAVELQIEKTIYELVSWIEGSFAFELDTLYPIDDIAVNPENLIPDLDLNTQMVLLHAARIFDERQHAAARGLTVDETWERAPRPSKEVEPPAKEPAPEPAIDLDELPAFRDRGGAEEVPAKAKRQPDTGLRLQLVSEDQVFAGRLNELMTAETVLVACSDLREVGRLSIGEPPDIVVVDLGPEESRLQEFRELCRQVPDTAFVGVTENLAASASLYEAGAVAVVPRNAEVVARCIQGISHLPGRSLIASMTESERQGFEKLKRIGSEIRSRVLFATSSLNLMNVIAESVERAVLFLAKRDHLVALGAFGFGAAGRPLAEQTRGLNVSITGENALVAAYRSGAAVATTFEEATLPAHFAEVIGRPKNGQIVVFPVQGSDRVIAVIYTDNGEMERRIAGVEIIDLATAQIGMAFENELLRSQLAKLRPTSKSEY